MIKKFIVLVTFVVGMNNFVQAADFGFPEVIKGTDTTRIKCVVQLRENTPPNSLPQILPLTVYDSDGNSHHISVSYTHRTGNSWALRFFSPSQNISFLNGTGQHILTFNGESLLEQIDNRPSRTFFLNVRWGNNTHDSSISIDLGPLNDANTTRIRGQYTIPLNTEIDGTGWGTFLQLQRQEGYYSNGLIISRHFAQTISPTGE